MLPTMLTRRSRGSSMWARGALNKEGCPMQSQDIRTQLASLHVLAASLRRSLLNSVHQFFRPPVLFNNGRMRSTAHRVSRKNTHGTTLIGFCHYEGHYY